MPDNQLTFQLASLFEALTDAGPDDVCLVAGPVRMTRRELDDRANRLAHHLLAAGVKPGELVGIHSYNRVEYVEALLGCWKISAAPVNLNYRYVADELRYVWNDASLTAMIAERTFVPLLNELHAEFPDTRTYLLLEDGTSHEPEFSATPYEEALAAQPAERGFGTERRADDHYVLYTGGTTGMPKGVVWRHEDIFFAGMGGGSYFEPITAPEEIVKNATEPTLPLNILATSPLMHGTGQWVTFISIFSGGSRACTRREASTRRRSSTPVLPRGPEPVADRRRDGRAVDRGDRAPARDLSQLMAIGNGGAVLSAPTRERLNQVLPGRIINDGYGAPETGAAGIGIDAKAGVDGARFSIDARTSVLDPDTLEPVPLGEKGMMARTGHIPLGYLNDEEKTAATFRTDARGRGG
ncbi:MAG: AMP-binding protein [Acidimicrobiales bacterium]